MSNSPQTTFLHARAPCRVKTMNKLLLGVALCVVAPLCSAADQRGNGDKSAVGQQVIRAGSHAAAVGPADYFTGRARVDPLFSASEEIKASGAYVTFEPGARSAWHSHPAGQRLVVVSGVGLTQEWGKPVQEIRPGDVITCPPEIRHWHGATPTSAMTHLAVSGVVEGKSVRWMEKVTDDQYNAR
jgi:quercetin dioxygenase-like cupin family protein